MVAGAVYDVVWRRNDYRDCPWWTLASYYAPLAAQPR